MKIFSLYSFRKECSHSAIPLANVSCSWVNKLWKERSSEGSKCCAIVSLQARFMAVTAAADVAWLYVSIIALFCDKWVSNWSVVFFRTGSSLFISVAMTDCSSLRIKSTLLCSKVCALFSNSDRIVDCNFETV